MHKFSLAELSSALEKKQFSSEELTRHYLKRITDLDQQLNSFITVTEELAIEQAKVADQRRAKGEAHPLTGLPIAHKDIFCTKDVKTSCASKMLDNFIAPYDATIVERLKNAGMVMLGKTNMDEFAMGSSNETSYYGAVKNPWDITRVPGGSSGGSSAAMAARLAPVATATDTGGSIRQPAALCGITGLKPTYGRVSRWGMIAFASSMDQGGLMAESAEDIALVMNTMAGHDAKDSTSVDITTPNYLEHLKDDLKGLRVGLPKEYLDGLDSRVKDLLDDFIADLTKLGAKVKEISLPNVSLSLPVYYVLAPAECSANLARFDGVRYGYRCDNPRDLLDLYERSRAEGFGAEVKRRIMIGTYVLSSSHFDDYYVKAQQVRRLIAHDYDEAFKDVDIIIGPTTPSTAFKCGEKASDPVSMYLSDIYTIATNLAGLPGISIPGGFIDNLPVGLQITGRAFDEARLLNVSYRYQQVTDWHKRLPESFV